MKKSFLNIMFFSFFIANFVAYNVKSFKTQAYYGK